MAFVDNCVTGKQNYFVDCDGSKMPLFRRESSLKVTYPIEENVRYIQNSSWCKIDDNMSLEKIVEEFGDVLSDIQIKKLENNAGISSTEPMISVPQSGAIFADGYLYSGSSTSYNSIPVYRTYWISTRRVYAKESPNKYLPGEENNRIEFLTDRKENDLLAKKNYKVKTCTIRTVQVHGESYT